MYSVLDTALSGLRRHEHGIQTVANNIANVNTDGYRAQRYDVASDSTRDRYEPGDHNVNEPAPSDVDLATEIVDLKRYEVGYAANAAVVRVADHLLGTLLDIFDDRR